MTEENTSGKELVPVLVVYREEDRDAILSVLQNAGISAEARNRGIKTKQVNDIVFVTSHGKRGQEICVDPADKQKAESIISRWTSEQKKNLSQSRMGGFLTGGSNSLPGKVLTVAVVIVVILMYVSRLR